MFYAKGYRLNSKDLTIEPSGLLVLKSYPSGAQIYVNGELKTATDATISLKPGTYDVSIRKEGFFEWKKRLTIEKEVVTEATAHLFRINPNLTAITFSSVEKIVPSHDYSKIAYIVSASNGTVETSGLWVLENINLPLGFAREPKRITDGDLSEAVFSWSPDDSKILLTLPKGSYLLDASAFTPQTSRVNIEARKEKIIEEWAETNKKHKQSQISTLPVEIQDILETAIQISFSPDKEMVLYTASKNAQIPPDLIKALPGASTQKQNRDIKPYHTYIYDIEEDRNFLVDDHSSDLQIEGGVPSEAKRRMMWYLSSRNVILADEKGITIMDYDGTNRQTVFNGSYLAPNAFPTLSLDRLIILTNFGATSKPADLYSLGIK